MVYPEINKLENLGNLFFWFVDELVSEDVNVSDEAYSDIRIEMVEASRYAKCAVISTAPEEDALNHVRHLAEELKIEISEIIGWNFIE